MVKADRGEPTRVAVIASGAGTTFAALADALDAPPGPARVVLLIVSRATAGARALAEIRSIECVVLDQRELGLDRADEQMAEVLRTRAIDLVVLAGYLRKVGPRTLGQFKGSILNTHPAPLPRFGGKGMYGDNVHRAVLEAGVAQSAATVHLVDADYDTGEILAQESVPVLDGDDITTLRARVQHTEQALLVRTVLSLTYRSTPDRQTPQRSRPSF